MPNEIPVYYYCNERLSTKSGMFLVGIDLNDNLRMIYEGNRFN